MVEKQKKMPFENTNTGLGLGVEGEIYTRCRFLNGHQGECASIESEIRGSPCLSHAASSGGGLVNGAAVVELTREGGGRRRGVRACSLACFPARVCVGERAGPRCAHTCNLNAS